MKYRYPFKQLWLPALLLALCLASTLISTVAWLILAASNESTDSYAATAETIIPALLMLATWIGCGILAGRLRMKTLLYFGIGFWSLELILYLLCLISPIYQAAQVFFSVVTLPMWSYFALIELIAAQNAAANAILTMLPTLVLIGVYLCQILRIRRCPRIDRISGKH